MGRGLGPGAEPLRAQVWTYRHRRAVRVVGLLALAAVVVDLVLAVRASDPVLPPVLSVVVWTTQVVLWGWVFPAGLRRDPVPGPDAGTPRP
ncbi:hypothetical protein SAMN04488544_1402 [Microlunatus sagamiharensis]|uniref:Uncharacterized protein n=1 Tax=Microlunatus sagamiharensis TaxID=546874 RepID=A0A1H2M5D7_9ACTN|nr:hypothetical protein [Microlunatus sagamiharensis]SDU88235.1 hypothetical protein SAMN04488544_1402 [Microlunatus sagamiharensis]